MRHVSNERRRKEKRGTGVGANYKPWLKTAEVPSQGTRVKEIDYKTGRTVHLMSETELYFWHLLRWNDDIIDIREQFPLDNELTTVIAEARGMMHPGGKDGVMTTDLLVTFADGTETAFSVKSNRSVLDDPRINEKLFIEIIYWGLKNRKCFVVWGEDLNMILVKNIIDVVHVYRLEDVMDDIGVIKYMISNKLITIDMETKRLNYVELVKVYRDTGKFKWVKSQAEKLNSTPTLSVKLST